MKIKFFYHHPKLQSGGYSEELYRDFMAEGDRPDFRNPYSAYLCGFISGCLSETWIQSMRMKIQEIMEGRRKQFEESTEGHFAKFSGDRVLIGRIISHRWTEVRQEDWEHSFHVLEFKAALEGWEVFLQMPVSIESEAVVEIPNLSN